MVFKKFKVLIEKMIGLYIKALRSDRGGEYMSTAFMSYCKEHEIKRFLTAPYSPQQNGVAEGKNRTILDMVRSILRSKDMTKEFWTETVQCGVYAKPVSTCDIGRSNTVKIQKSPILNVTSILVILY